MMNWKTEQIASSKLLRTASPYKSVSGIVLQLVTDTIRINLLVLKISYMREHSQKGDRNK